MKARGRSRASPGPPVGCDGGMAPQPHSVWHLVDGLHGHLDCCAAHANYNWALADCYLLLCRLTTMSSCLGCCLGCRASWTACVSSLHVSDGMTEAFARLWQNSNGAVVCLAARLIRHNCKALVCNRLSSIMRRACNICATCATLPCA